jgi:hypothetical protein
VLETQILPRFTSCFAQLTEGVAPGVTLTLTHTP